MSDTENIAETIAELNKKGELLEEYEGKISWMLEKASELTKDNTERRIADIVLTKQLIKAGVFGFLVYLVAFFAG